MAWSLPVLPASGTRVRSSLTSAAKRASRPKPRIERLEDRTLMTGGQLDPAFGSGGIVTTPFAGGDIAYDVAIQPDGKIVAAGVTSSNSNDFAVVRYNANGSLDTTFGTGGKVTTDFGGNDVARGLVIQPDGKIVVAGSTSVASNFAMARYNANGTLDNGFGQAGLVTTHLGGVDAANSIALQTDGKIVLAGVSDNRFALVRYTSAGLTDATFGNAGVVITDPSGINTNSQANDVIIQPNGAIVAGGLSGGSFALVRYLTSGLPDTGFGTGGIVVTSTANRVNAIHDLALQGDGRIVAVGESFDPTKGNDFALVRYNTDGSVDANFGDQGTVIGDFNVTDIANGVIIQPDSKIVAAGFSSPGTFRVARYNTDGSLDTGFGTNGSVAAPTGTGNAIAYEASDSKIVVAGTTGTNFALARYFTGNPMGDFSFSSTVFTGRDGGTATITVNRLGGSLGAVSVRYATSDGSATAGVQYVATSGVLNFAAGQTSQTFTVTLLPDGIIDGTTTVNLTLSTPGGGATLGTPATAVLNIIDAPGTLQFSAATYTVAGSAPSATITVTRAVGSGGTISIDYATSDGTAKAGIDYQTSAGTLVFPDGALTAQFNVPLLSDPTASGTLTVNLSLSNPTGGATIGDQATAILNITVAPGDFVFSAASFNGKEDDGLATITVSRVNGADGAGTVTYATSDGTATAGVNYSAASGVLTFAPGQTSRTFTVPIIQDNTINGNLSVNLTLSNPTGGPALGGRKNAILIIIDSPGKLQFGSPSASVPEEIGTTFISIVRTVGVGGLVSVNYATSDGTAVAGTDYTAASGTVTFGPGELAKVIPIAIHNDGRIGGVNKTFTITLTNPAGGASLGTPSSTTVAILDSHHPGTDGDYTASGKTALTVYRPSTGQFLIRGVGVLGLGQAGDIPVPGAYDGNRTTEAAVYRPGTAQWFINGFNSVRVVQFGAAGTDIPVPADYDGDGKTDIAVYRPSTGRWFILGSTIGPQARTFGAPNLDQPVPADYDGDGVADLAVYRPSTGQWLLDQSFAGRTIRQFGAPGLDKPIPSDFDGDDKTDLAVFRPTTDQWLILKSSGGTIIKQFGAPGRDLPVPGDYDGDGKADLAVYRRSTAQWLVLPSNGGPGQITQFGFANNDNPAQPPIAFRSGLTSVASVAPQGSASPSGGGLIRAAVSSVGSGAAEASLQSQAASSMPPSDGAVHDHALASVETQFGHGARRIRLAHLINAHRIRQAQRHV